MLQICVFFFSFSAVWWTFDSIKWCYLATGLARILQGLTEL